MTEKSIALLGGDSWTVSEDKKLSDIMLRYMISQDSQSNRYAGMISSSDKDMQAGEMADQIQAMESTLRRYLARFYETVNLSIEENKERENTVDMKLTVVENGKQFSYHYAIQNSPKLRQLIYHNKTGDRLVTAITKTQTIEG